MAVKCKVSSASPEVQLRKAAGSTICKIIIDRHGRQAMTEVIRKVFSEHPSELEPRTYLAPAREELIKAVKYKNEHVLDSATKPDIERILCILSRSCVIKLSTMSNTMD